MAYGLLMRWASLAGVVVLGVPVVLVVGCAAKGVSRESLESEIQQQLDGDGPAEVSCADDLEDEVGASTQCEITQGGYTFSATIQISSIRDGVAHFAVSIDDNPVPDG